MFFTYCAKKDVFGKSKSMAISLMLLLEYLSSEMICSIAFSWIRLRAFFPLICLMIRERYLGE